MVSRPGGRIALSAEWRGGVRQRHLRYAMGVTRRAEYRPAVGGGEAGFGRGSWGRGEAGSGCPRSGRGSLERRAMA